MRQAVVVTINHCSSSLHLEQQLIPFVYLMMLLCRSLARCVVKGGSISVTVSLPPGTPDGLHLDCSSQPLLLLTCCFLSLPHAGVNSKAMQEAATKLAASLGDPAAVVLATRVEATGQANFVAAFSPKVVAAGQHAGGWCQ
jgi:hypothetical protein